MPGPGGVQSLGEIARQFSQGFIQGRQTRHQEHYQGLQEKQQHIENLSRLSEIHKNNPSMRETIDTQLEQAIHDMESSSNGVKTKPPKEGTASSLFSGIKNLFSRKGPQATPGTSYTDLMPEADKESTGADRTPAPFSSGPPAAAPGSQTYGDLGEYFGGPSQPNPTTQVTGGMPRVSVKPPMSQLDQSRPPALPTPPGAPAVQPAAAPAQPQASRPAQPGGGLPTPSSIRQHALSAESTPKYGYYDQGKVAMRANTEASEALDEALGMAEAALDHHPEIKTFADATAHPEIGGTFRTLMDYAARLEGSGLVEKGYVDQWKQNRFPDARQGYQHPPAAIPDAQMTLEQKVDHGKATPAEFEQYMNIVHTKAANAHIQGPLTPREEAYKNADDALKAKGLTPVERYTQLARVDNAPQKPNRELKAVPNPRTGQNEWAWITEGVPQPEFTGQRTSDQFDIGRLKTSATIMTPAGPGSPVMIPKIISDWSPVEVTKAMKNGQITSGDARMILQDMKDPAGKQAVQDFIDNPGKYQ